MKRKIVLTADGSPTIQIQDWDEQYHSKHGAVQEALHVFIRMGLHPVAERFETSPIPILEIGFGTGLNALLSVLEAEKHQRNLHYTGVEAYPVRQEEIEQLHYSKSLQLPSNQVFTRLHQADWEKDVAINPYFTLHKKKLFFEEIKAEAAYRLIYFDAFGLRVQPNLWGENIFRKMYKALLPDGVLVTYAANGKAKRAMKKVGFEVQKLPGPPGKREMLRALKPL